MIAVYRDQSVFFFFLFGFFIPEAPGENHEGRADAADSAVRRGRAERLKTVCCDHWRIGRAVINRSRPTLKIIHRVIINTHEMWRARKSVCTRPPPSKPNSPVVCVHTDLRTNAVGY